MKSGIWFVMAAERHTACETALMALHPQKNFSLGSSGMAATDSLPFLFLKITIMMNSNQDISSMGVFYTNFGSDPFPFPFEGASDTGVACLGEALL